MNDFKRINSSDPRFLYKEKETGIISDNISNLLARFMTMLEYLGPRLSFHPPIARKTFLTRDPGAFFRATVLS